MGSAFKIFLIASGKGNNSSCEFPEENRKIHIQHTAIHELKCVLFYHIKSYQ